VFCGQLGRLLELHESYGDRAAFLFVAIRDAGHPDPALPFLSGALGATPAGRVEMIRKGLDAYKIPFPGLVDEGRRVERAYHAYPQRLVIVGSDGRIVFDAGRGSRGGPSNWDLEAVEGHLRSALDDVVSPIHFERFSTNRCILVPSLASKVWGASSPIGA
jgi:hypothetical protein